MVWGKLHFSHPLPSSPYQLALAGFLFPIGIYVAYQTGEQVTNTMNLVGIFYSFFDSLAETYLGKEKSEISVYLGTYSYSF